MKHTVRFLALVLVLALAVPGLALASSYVGGVLPGKNHHPHQRRQPGFPDQRRERLGASHLCG